MEARSRFEDSHLTSQNDSDDVSENESSQKKRKLSNSESEEDSRFMEGEEISDYELIQKRNLNERIQFLKNLKIDDPLKELLPFVDNKSKSKKPKKKKNFLSDLPKREPSRRIKQLGAKKYVEEEEETSRNDSIDNTVQEAKVDLDDRLSGTVKFDYDDEPVNLEDLNFTYDPNLDFSNCSLANFKGQLSCLTMMKPLTKITNKRIQSLAVHPSLTKRIILVGSVSGELGLWNADSAETVLSYHKAPVNCITVSNYDNYKIFTTSHDGTMCTVDMNSKQYSNLFSTDYSDRIKHLTWHDELDANTLLISHGNGDVGVLDLREGNNKISWTECFDRSARTVQHHPVHSDYFLVSSGTSGCKIFDLRLKKKNRFVCEMLHPKGLTSAFFSPDGTKILTTCNDDYLRIFDALSFQNKIPHEENSIAHNNHTGRWLSVFKAMWLPKRNDTFIIGSLMSPRRIQIYDNNGSIVYNLNDEEMSTICPVIAAHPTLPLIAGGNSSGRVHLFVAPDLKEKIE